MVPAAAFQSEQFRRNCRSTNLRCSNTNSEAYVVNGEKIFGILTTLFFTTNQKQYLVQCQSLNLHYLQCIRFKLLQPVFNLFATP